MFGFNQKKENNVEHFGKRKKSVKVSAGDVLLILLVLIAIALFVYIGSRNDTTATTTSTGTTGAAQPSVLKPVTGGSRYRK